MSAIRLCSHCSADIEYVPPEYGGPAEGDDRRHIADSMTSERQFRHAGGHDSASPVRCMRLEGPIKEATNESSDRFWLDVRRETNNRRPEP